MAKYIKFNFEDCYGDNHPIIIRFEENLTNEQLIEIENKLQDVIDDFRKNENSCDTDEVILEKVLSQFDYKYEYIPNIFGAIIDC